ncbi:hypothetical protein ACWDUL_29760 [Nocardia niigatensis]|uniref:hypothetical protein n=1 Tax=Nocardia niigatensis TaxID=209249 RepID=UPI0002FF76B8|nr:hypothetical protein [Nocardia niigatensis]
MGQLRDPVVATKIVNEVAELGRASIRVTPLDRTWRVAGNLVGRFGQRGMRQ